MVLTENASLLPDSGRALDVACGSGANSLFLARRGINVESWDISAVVIEALAARAGDLPLTARVVDISPASLEGFTFDVIVNCHYLDRSLLGPMIASLSPGGLIFFQTFLKNRALATGPSNPDFLLDDGELHSMMQGLDILAARDGALVSDPEDPLAGRACIVARKP